MIYSEGFVGNDFADVNAFDVIDRGDSFVNFDAFNQAEIISEEFERESRRYSKGFDEENEAMFK